MKRTSCPARLPPPRPRATRDLTPRPAPPHLPHRAAHPPAPHRAAPPPARPAPPISRAAHLPHRAAHLPPRPAPPTSRAAPRRPPPAPHRAAHFPRPRPAPPTSRSAPPTSRPARLPSPAPRAARDLAYTSPLPISKNQEVHICKTWFTLAKFKSSLSPNSEVQKAAA
nr:vegetative cell wall protein gp1-like [Lolium perenne]